MRKDRTASRTAERDAPALFDRLVHDLRNPLGVIAYYAEALAGSPEAGRDELCDRLQVNAQRALQVLEEFSLLADLRHGHLDGERGEWDVPEVLAREVAPQVQRMERSAQPIVCAGQAGVRARGDASRWSCALRGLLREVVRSVRGERSLSLACGRAGELVVLRLTVPVVVDPELGALPCELPPLQLELVERLAKLDGGRVRSESTPDAVTLVLTLPAVRA